MRWGMVVDMERCTSCQACVVACSTENNVALGSAEDAAAGRIIRWLQMLPEVEGEYPHISGNQTPMMCQHCDDPPCTSVCPVAATYKNSEGLVAQIYDRCIGCRFCVNACPYTVKFFNWRKPEWRGRSSEGTNPDVSLRDVGVTEKCSHCHHRLQAARDEARREGRQVREQDYQPACAEACPSSAIIFGDLDNPESDAARKARAPRAFKYLEDLGTRPKVTYLKSRAGLDDLPPREKSS